VSGGEHKRPVEIVRLYVIESLERDVDFIVDDPFGTFGHHMTPKEILAHMQRLDRIAEICDVKLASLIMARASTDELRRLQKFMKDTRTKADADLA